MKILSIDERAPDPLDQDPQPATILRLLLFVGLAASPHLLLLNPLYSGLFFLSLFYRALCLRLPQLLPGSRLLALFTIGAIVLVMSRGNGLENYQSGVSLLLVLAGLKPLEIRRRRDIYFSVALGLFLTITVFLFENSIPVALLMLLSSLGLCAVMVELSWIHRPEGFWSPLRQVLLMSLPALPLALLLFFLFPRLGGPLWSFNLGHSVSRTGLSDSIRAGTISQLSQSHEVAFRVIFDGPPPPPPERYWRGPVLWLTDGRDWKRSERMLEPIKQPPRSVTSRGYTVFLEANDNPWFMLLDVPDQAPPGGWLSRDRQVPSKTLHLRPQKYQGRSSPRFPPQALDELEQLLGLQLPPKVSPRVRQLVQQWQQQARHPAEVVELALRYFRQQPFVYTLHPVLLRDDPLEEFLFDTRQGFCEHFATSFTLLMRLAGIPSRVVTGYLGGEENPHSDYMIVRQSDAHAWSEVWLPEQGWTRVDPTAAVAPERIEHALDIDALSNTGQAARFQIDNPRMLQALGRNLRWGMDALHLSWQRWIVNYDQGRQSSLLSHFGLDRWNFRQIALLATGLVVGTLLLLYLWSRRRDRRPIDPAAAAYGLFLHKMAKAGLPCAPHEGPLDYQQRIAQQRPELVPETARITSQYIRLRYGRGVRDELRVFRETCKRFRVGPLAVD